MTGTAPRSAASNAGDGKAVSENGRRGTANGRVGRFGRSLRPARSISRGPEAEIAWKVAFSGHTLTEGIPYGECRLKEYIQQCSTPTSVGAWCNAFSVRNLLVFTLGFRDPKILDPLFEGLRNAGFPEEPS